MTSRRGGIAALALLVGVLGLPASAGAARNHPPGAPTHLTVGDGPTQLGITGTPRFSWWDADRDPDEVQSQYEIIVSTAPTTDSSDDSVVWDSGRVKSSEQTYVQYAGPALDPDTTYYWTVSICDHTGADGPFAKPQRFDTGLGDADWQASWIKRGAFTPGDEIPEDFSYVRKEVALSASPITRAVAYVSASHHYELYINGERRDFGPSFSYPDKQYYQSTDVTDALQAGKPNAFGLLYHWYGSGQGRPLAAPGVIAQISITHDDGTHESVITDGSWRVLAGPWLPAPKRNDEGDFVEHIDGGRVPIGWDEPGFDDATWAPATVIGPHPTAPWTHLVSQEPRVVEEPVMPVSVKRLKSGSVVADYGKVYAAVPTVTFHKGEAGRTIKMHLGYVLDPDGQVSTTKSTQDTDLSYEYIQRDGEQAFHPALYMGFRYLQVDDPGEELAAKDLVAYGRHNEVPDENAATFSSSNKTLDAIWELARHTGLYGAQEQFVDTPTREKGQFLGDAYYTAFADTRAFGEQALARQALLEFASSQARYWPDGRVNGAEPTGEGARDIPDTTEQFPEWVWQTYLETGDHELLDATYPVLVNICDYLARAIDPETGLVTDLPGGGVDYKGGLVDYPFNMRFGYDMATSARTTVNLLAVDAFKRTFEIAAAIGAPRVEADLQNERATALARAIADHLQGEDGLYIDGLHANGKPSVHASQHANAYALSFGVTPKGERAVGDYVARLGMKMGPGTVLELLRALDLSGHDADLVRILTDKKQPGWAQILAKGGTFVWETWMPIDALGDSMSHSRGAIALVGLQQELLGVQTLKPGWSVFEVAPPSGGLDHAAGRVPTARGFVRVSWSRDGDGKYTVHVHVPMNTTAVVRIPGEKDVRVGSGDHVLTSSD